MCLCLFASVFACRQLRSVLPTCCSGLLSPGGSVTNNKSLVSTVAGHFFKSIFPHFSHLFWTPLSLSGPLFNQSAFLLCTMSFTLSYVWLVFMGGLQTGTCMAAFANKDAAMLEACRLSGCDGNVHGLVNWLWHWINLSQPLELQKTDWGEH